MAFIGTLSFFYVERKHARVKDLGYDPISWLEKNREQKEEPEYRPPLRNSQEDLEV